MITRRELKENSKQQLRGKWGVAIGTCFVYGLLSGISGAFSAETSPGFYLTLNIVTLLISGPLAVGINRFMLTLARGKEEPRFVQLFSGFSDVFLKSLGVMILFGLIVFVGIILLVIPGIIATFMYSQAFYILADDPSISVVECLRKSRQMMVGHKFDYFVLQLSFIGWAILCVFTLGIGFLWLMPYMEVALANYYLELKAEN